MTKTDILDAFDSNMEKNAIDIVKAWESREISDFGQKLMRLSKVFEQYGSDNMFSLINDAYFFDGDKEQCVKKIKKTLKESRIRLTTDVQEIVDDLETMANLNIDDTGITEFINDNKGEVVSERSTTLDFSQDKDFEFILSWEKKDICIRGPKVIGQFDVVQHVFYFDFTTNKLEDHEAEYIGWKVYQDTMATTRSEICGDMTLVLYDKTTNEKESIVHFRSAYVSGFQNNGNILTLHINADWYEIEKDDDDQVANFVRNEISNVFHDPNPFESYTERMKACNYEDDF